MSSAESSAKTSGAQKVGLAARFDAAFRAPAPAERLAAIRIIIGLFALIYLSVRSVSILSAVNFHASTFAPIGVVQVLSAPQPSTVVYASLFGAIATAACFTLGFRFRFTAPLFAFLLLWVLTYRNSWGMIFHTENLLVMHVLVLSLTPAGDAWSLDARRDRLRGMTPPRPSWRYGWPLKLMSAITAFAYTLAAIAKLQNSGVEWITSDILRNYVAYDNLRKIILGDTHSILGAELVRYGWLFPPLAAVSMVLELFAPLALLHRRIAKWWCINVWLFHVGVLATMAIFFPYPLLGLGFLSFFEPERLVRWVTRRFTKRGPDRDTDDVPKGKRKKKKSAARRASPVKAVAT